MNSGGPYKCDKEKRELEENEVRHTEKYGPVHVYDPDGEELDEPHTLTGLPIDSTVPMFKEPPPFQFDKSSKPESEDD